MYLTQTEIIKNFISNFIDYAEDKLSEKELNLFLSFQSQISYSLIAEIATSYDDFGAEHKFEITMARRDENGDVIDDIWYKFDIDEWQDYKQIYHDEKINDIEVDRWYKDRQVGSNEWYSWEALEEDEYPDFVRYIISEIKRIDLDLNLSKTFRKYDEKKKQKVRSSLVRNKDLDILQRLIQRPCNTKLLLGKFAHEGLGFTKDTLIPKLLNYKIETDCYSQSTLEDIYADYPQQLIIEVLKEHLPSENIIKDYETSFSNKYKEINLNLKEYKDRNIDVVEFVNKMQQLEFESLELLREDKLTEKEFDYLRKTIASNR